LIDHSLSAKLVPTFADKGVLLVSPAFLDWSRYIFFQVAIWQRRESNPDFWICSQISVLNQRQKLIQLTI
jgi:hypothetical protein